MSFHVRAIISPYLIPVAVSYTHLDVYKRQDVARDFIETDANIFWAQLGLQSQEAEQILREAGRNKIVMNRCIKIEYAYSGLGKK